MRVPVTALVGHPGEIRPYDVVVDATDVSPDWGPSDLQAVGPLRLDLVLESVVEGILVRGTVSAPLTIACARCLTDVVVDHTVEVTELFTDPRRTYSDLDDAESEEGYELVDDATAIDLSVLARDSVLTDLPMRTLCGPDCAGLCPTCGVDRNTTTCTCAPTPPTDPRWAVLADVDLPDD